MKFVPILNSEAGLTLTPQQWQSTGSTHYAFNVSELLKRPGLVAMTLQAPGPFILDIRGLELNAKKQLVYRKIDGAKQTVESADFTDWLMSLGALGWVGDASRWNISLPYFTAYPVSDLPASDAYQGIFYTQLGSCEILESRFEKDLGLLDEQCRCQTCSQGFTRAYFHHLLQHTPLLAQRMMIEHNVFFAQLHGIRAV